MFDFVFIGTVLYRAVLTYELVPRKAGVTAYRAAVGDSSRALLAEEREQWQAVNSTLQGIWRALSIPGPANHAASAAPLPQEG